MFARHAPAAASPLADAGAPLLRTLGSNQLGMREFNERVILRAIRLHGAMPKTDLARLTRLSTQTVSVIINRLLAEGMVLKRDSLRGKVGQPSQPIALHPDGAFSIGIQIGRRRLKVMLMDFAGQPRHLSTLAYATPDVEQVFAEIAVQLRAIDALLGPDKARRLSGVGVSAPLVFGGWQQLLGMPPGDAAAWARVRMDERLAALTPLPLEFAKDTAAASVAELVAGRGRNVRSYAYVFIDTLTGGGLVLDSQPHAGRFGNAGAIGSLPLGLAGRGMDAEAPPAQLLDVASLITLENAYAQAGLDETACTDARALQAPWLALTDAWMAQAADAIAYAVLGAACLLDMQAVIIDGAIARDFLARLLAAVERAMDRYEWQGVMRPELLAGAIGPDAKVSGAAYLPLHAHFSPVHDVFLK